MPCKYMDAGHTSVKRHADDVQVFQVVGNELFFRHATHRLDLISRAVCSKFSARLGQIPPLPKLVKHLLIFA